MGDHIIPVYRTYADCHSFQDFLKEGEGRLKIARNLVDISLSPEKGESILKEFERKFSSREVLCCADSISSYLSKDDSFFKMVDKIAKEKRATIQRTESEAPHFFAKTSYNNLVKIAVYEHFLVN